MAALENQMGNLSKFHLSNQISNSETNELEDQSKILKKS